MTSKPIFIIHLDDVPEEETGWYESEEDALYAIDCIYPLSMLERIKVVRYVSE